MNVIGYVVLIFLNNAQRNAGFIFIYQKYLKNFEDSKNLLKIFSKTTKIFFKILANI